MNIASSKVKVFPFGSPRDDDSYGRILNEYNIRQIIKSVVDRSSYVLSYDSNTHICEFLLEGYYFKADLSEFVSYIGKNSIYASIQLSTIDGSSNQTYLLGGDSSDGTFTGLTIETNTPEYGVDKYSICLLDSKGEVPSSSLIKFNMTSLGGELDLDGYATKEDISDALTGYYTKEEIENKKYVTETELPDDYVTDVSFESFTEGFTKVSEVVDQIGLIYCGNATTLID